MNTRQALALELGTLLGTDDYFMIASPREVITFDPSYRAGVQVIRTTIAPLPNAPIGNLLESFELWIIEPGSDVDEAEDRLDESLADVLAKLNSVDWVAWTSAEREPWDNNRYHAYKINLEAVSSITEMESAP